MMAELGEHVNAALRAFEEEHPDPQLLVIGATGTGKSSLVNRLFNQRLQAVNRVESTTREFATHTFDVNGTRVSITDSPGYGEVDHDEEYAANVVRASANAHAIVLVLKADEKGYQRDLDIVRAVSAHPDCPRDKAVIIALNQIDKLPPVRDWAPPYDLGKGSESTDSLKLRHMREKVALVEEQFAGVLQGRHHEVIPVMLEPAEGPTFGVRRFREALFEALPAVAQVKYALASKVAEQASEEFVMRLDKAADAIILKAASAAAGGVLVNPIPLSDFLLLAPIQVGLVIKLGSLYGHPVDKSSAPEVLGALGGGVLARSLFQQVISLLPGAKNVLGPPYAAAATHGIGSVAKRYFKSGSLPSEEELRVQVETQLYHRLEA